MTIYVCVSHTTIYTYAYIELLSYSVIVDDSMT